MRVGGRIRDSPSPHREVLKTKLIVNLKRLIEVCSVKIENSINCIFNFFRFKSFTQ